MNRPINPSANGARTGHAEPLGPTAQDTHWAGERRSALGVASLLFSALLVLDAGAGRLDVTRGALWSGLAVLLFVVLLPPRVSTRPGLLSARGLLVERSVRTDRLVSVRWSDGVAQRMVLRDTQGGRVEIDPAVLVRNPAMWRRLDADTRTSVERGTLLCGATALRRLAGRIDRETAHTVFRVSGLE
ncbi:hypothetical protein OHS33_01045 [Streptomyces sp. NBC_00536]|uniref:hypothetical protein n=1 Tax=Streptomyces sp. NBC_00536 TaxID=2975769 RepID=UPI002E80918E|nr:hypothetical protein [Streptomyces sp. NBC_00536]WUC77057.1 hypothetical protein OHS33_01045 [Streptomyces sp. NBC_00536]